MIVKSSYRQAGGLHAHVTRSDTNEAVHVRLDLFRGIASDLAEALHDMEALARLNPAIERAFVHIVISPGHVLTNEELLTALAIVENEHGIAPEAKRAVVEHEKGARPAHYHCVYPIVDPRTGRALRSQGNFERDELISRLLEISLGERITPGPRLQANIGELRARNRHQEADILATHAPQQQIDPLDRKTRQRATRLGIDAVAWSRDVSMIFEKAGRDFAAFERRLAPAGLRLARGDKAILIVDAATGYYDVLVRLLRREAKALGRPLVFTEAEVGEAFPTAAPLAAVRNEGIATARIEASTALTTEWWRALQEAMADSDAGALKSFRAKRRAEHSSRLEAERRAFTATLKARREAIRALYWRRDEVRRWRVDRAFRAAGLFQSPQVRRLAFALAAAGILLTGAGLAAALIGAGVVVGALPSRARARRFAAAARADRQRDQAVRSSELDRAYDDVRQTFARGPMPVRFSFDQVAKNDRILAGFVADAILSGRPPVDQPVQVAQAMQALGPDVVGGLTRMLERGSGPQIRRLMHWHRGVDPGRRHKAIDAALGRHAGTDPGANGPGSTPHVARRAKRRQVGRTRNGGRGR